MTNFITSLPEPVFVESDPAVIRAEMIAKFEELTGRPLLESQAEMAMIDLFVYRESLARMAMNEAAKQNLAQYAVFPMLNYLGAMKGVIQRDSELALTTLRFTLVAVQAFDVLVPAGTRVRSVDGKVIFATSAPLTIVAGELAGDVAAAATTAGVIGNGYAPGHVSTLMDPLAHVAGATNTTATSGGDEVEDIEEYRKRVLLAPEGFSTAGPRAAYVHHARQASSTIIDVAVVKPEPGKIVVYPLTTTGAPSQELLDLVAEYLSDDKIRPMTDELEVLAPTAVERTWTGSLTVYADADAAAVKLAAETALAEYAALLRSKLKQDHIPERAEAVVNSLKGAHRFQLEGVEFETLEANEWLDITSITVNLVGVAS